MSDPAATSPTNVGFQPAPQQGQAVAYSNPAFDPQQGQPQYGQPQPQYGQPQPQYGQPQPQYGQPQPGGYPPPPPGAVTGQPQSVQWMAKPEGPQGCPPGLEYLSQIDQLLVHQQVELIEAFTSWESKNKYQIKNSMGQQVYFAAEESDACMRQCCKSGRGFTMHITDNMGQEVIRVIREFKCCADSCSWCACCSACQCEIEIQAPVGTTVGYVRQLCSFCAPKFEILDADMQQVFAAEGPCCICDGLCCTWDQEFKVCSPDMSQEVGKISKQWTGAVKELFTKADNFGVAFPLDLDVKMKAVLLGAVFLIDFMFFEEDENNNNNN